MVKRSVKVLAAVFLVVVIVLVVKTCCAENHNFYTDDVDNYNVEPYLVPKVIFPQKIPENADVVCFSYYDYWYEEEDFYLELKFDTEKEMEEYLQTFSIDSEKDFFKSQNTHNDSFVDYFCLLYNYISQNNFRFGYEIKENDGSMLYDCIFGVISCSFDELTVIHSYTSGHFIPTVHEHLPKYFMRFGVPLDSDYRRVYEMPLDTD